VYLPLLVTMQCCHFRSTTDQYTLEQDSLSQYGKTLELAFMLRSNNRYLRWYGVESSIIFIQALARRNDQLRRMEVGPTNRPLAFARSPKASLAVSGRLSPTKATNQRPINHPFINPVQLNPIVPVIRSIRSIRSLFGLVEDEIFAELLRSGPSRFR
jgi:hypothetical protein